MKPRAGHPATWLASALGTGYLWPAPGTWGSLLGIVVFAVLLAETSLVVQIIALVAVVVAGTWSAQVVAVRIGIKDPSVVVIDEVAGMWLATLGITALPGWIAAFFLFRAFDIVKPFPARHTEALPGGVGIMADDLVAGAYAQLATRLFLLAWGPG